MGFIQRVQILSALQKIMDTHSKQSVMGSVSKDEIIQELLKAKKDTEFKETLRDYYFSEIVHDYGTEGDGGDEEDEEDEKEFKEKVAKKLNEKFKKFTSIFKPTFENGKLIVWREIFEREANDYGTEDDYKLDYDHLGIYWSWDEDYAESHWQHLYSGDGTSVILKAAVDKKDIDFVGTLATILGVKDVKDAGNEREVRLEEWTKIQLLEPKKRWAKT